MPRGNVQMTPVPIVAGSEIRRKSVVGLVGDVPHASAEYIVAAGFPGSSARSKTGEVGVIPEICYGHGGTPLFIDHKI